MTTKPINQYESPVKMNARRIAISIWLFMLSGPLFYGVLAWGFMQDEEPNPITTELKQLQMIFIALAAVTFIFGMLFPRLMKTLKPMRNLIVQLSFFEVVSAIGLTESLIFKQISVFYPYAIVALFGMCLVYPRGFK